MGIVSSPLSQSNNMKFLLVLAVAASVSAEADPQLLYNYPLAYHHAPLAYHPVVYTAPAVGCRNNDGALVPCAHGVLPYALAAPAPAAEPEADPWLYYHGLGYAARPYGYGYYGHHLGYYGHHLGYAAYHPYAYSHYGYYGKRSAEAEPTAEADAEASPEADPWLYYSHAGYGLHPYGYGYHGLGYAAYAGYHPYAYYG